MHLLLMAGVFASLCFSSGEGVRLLPFALNEAEDNAIFFNGRSFQQHTPSLHRTGEHKLDLFAKNKKESKRQSYQQTLLTAWPYADYYQQFLLSARNELSENFITIPSFSQPSNRAPPI